MPRPVVNPCGTFAAYQRHLRNREVPCVPCTIATARHRAAQRLAAPGGQKCARGLGWPLNPGRNPR